MFEIKMTPIFFECKIKKGRRRRKNSLNFFEEEFFEETLEIFFVEEFFAGLFFMKNSLLKIILQNKYELYP